MDGRVSERGVLTPADFLENLEPVVQFVAPKEQPEIPKGLLACCRVVHQVDCEFHVARSLVGAATRRRFEDGTEEEWIHPYPVDYPGDILVTPTMLFAAVKIHWTLARETAKKLGALVFEMTVAIFHLDTTGSAAYDEAMRGYKAAMQATEVESAALMTPEQIRALPVEYVGEPEELAALIAEQTLIPAELYAERVEILPNEIGHNERARYLSSAVVEAPEQEAMQWIADPDPFPKQPPSP